MGLIFSRVSSSSLAIRTRGVGIVLRFGPSLPHARPASNTQSKISHRLTTESLPLLRLPHAGDLETFVTLLGPHNAAIQQIGDGQVQLMIVLRAFRDHANQLAQGQSVFAHAHKSPFMAIPYW